MKRRSQHGYTMLEVLLAFSLLLIGLTALAESELQALQITRHLYLTTKQWVAHE